MMWLVIGFLVAAVLALGIFKPTGKEMGEVNDRLKALEKLYTPLPNTLPNTLPNILDTPIYLVREQSEDEGVDPFVWVTTVDKAIWGVPGITQKVVKTTLGALLAVLLTAHDVQIEVPKSANYTIKER